MSSRRQSGSRFQRRWPPRQEAKLCMPRALQWRQSAPRPRFAMSDPTGPVSPKTLRPIAPHRRTKMTSQRSSAQRLNPTPKPRRKRIQPAPVIAVGATTFALVLGLLGWQVAIGKDPSLGHGKQKPKIVHRRIHRTIVTRVYDKPKVVYVPADSAYSSGSNSSGASDGGGYSGYSSGYGGGSSSSSSGSSSYSAPTYSAPSYSPPAVSSGAS